MAEVREKIRETEAKKEAEEKLRREKVTRDKDVKSGKNPERKKRGLLLYSMEEDLAISNKAIELYVFLVFFFSRVFHLSLLCTIREKKRPLSSF